MSKELQFDVEKLTNTKDKCKTMAQSLKDKKEELEEELEALKKDWNTDAGREFFKTQNTDWAEQVDSYVKITNAVVELLECAISRYSEVETAAKSLKMRS